MKEKLRKFLFYIAKSKGHSAATMMDDAAATMMDEIKYFASIIQNENLFAYLMQCFNYKLNLFCTKSCNFATVRNIFLISIKACDCNQFIINQNSKTGRNVQIDSVQMK